MPILDFLDKVPLLNSKNTIVRMIGFIILISVFVMLTDLLNFGDDNSIMPGLTADSREPTWMKLKVIEQGDGHRLHVTLYDDNENKVISDGKLQLSYFPMLSGYGTRYDEIKNETIQVTRSMFNDGVLKLHRIKNEEMDILLYKKSYEVNGIGGGRYTLPPDGVKISAVFMLPSGEGLKDYTEWWQPRAYE